MVRFCFRQCCHCCYWLKPGRSCSTRRVAAENHLILPGRFRAHAGAPARSGQPGVDLASNDRRAAAGIGYNRGAASHTAQAASSYRIAFPSYDATGGGGAAAGAGGGAGGPSTARTYKHEGAQLSSAQLNARRGATGSSSHPVTPTRRRNRRLSSQRAPGSAGGGGALSERAWLLRPTRDRVETWLDAWWKRWLVLVIVPSCIVSPRSA